MASGKFLKVNDELDFSLFFRIFKKNVMLILVIFFTCCLFAFIFNRYSIPVFSTRSIIQVDDKNESSYILKNENFVKDDNIAKKVDFLRSSSFLSRVFNNLPLQVLYYREGTIIEDDLYKKTPFSANIDIENPALYDQPIYIEILNNKTYEVKYKNQDVNIEKTAGFGDSLHLPGLKIAVILNSSDASAYFNAKFFIKAINPENLVQYYSNNLIINILNESSKTISIEYKDKNPFRAADIVNRIAEEFKAYDIEKKQESATNIIKYIDQQLVLIENSLSENENSLVKFKSENNLNNNVNNIKPLSIIQTNINFYIIVIL